jgi:hypothetical protein
MARLGLGEMIGAGPRAVGRYTGTLLAVFVVQSLVAFACMIAVTIVLARTFSALPIFDDAVDGDLVSLIYCVRHGYKAVEASAGIVLGALLLWQLVSWFLVGGIYGVLAQRPEGRGETARCFGASGATTFLAYARLALCSLPGWILVVFVFLTGLALVDKRLEYALTLPQLVGPVVLATLPALLLAHVVMTIGDYARVELTLRHESHDPSALRTYARSAAYVLKRPMTLAHAGLGWLAVAFVTVVFAFFAHGHPMYGADGAVTLFVIRSGVALARTSIRFGVLGGQLELGKTRALPPRRVEIKSESKKS